LKGLNYKPNTLAPSLVSKRNDQLDGENGRKMQLCHFLSVHLTIPSIVNFNSIAYKIVICLTRVRVVGYGLILGCLCEGSVLFSLAQSPDRHQGMDFKLVFNHVEMTNSLISMQNVQIDIS
jgi:hypothetical protein